MSFLPDGLTEAPDHGEPSEEELRELAEACEAGREELYEAFVAIRRQEPDFMKRTIVTVLAPLCEDCFSRKVHYFGRDWRPPDLSPNTWRSELMSYGVSKEELKRFGNDDLGGVSCHECHRSLRFDREPAYIDDLAFDSYFQELWVIAEGDLSSILVIAGARRPHAPGGPLFKDVLAHYGVVAMPCRIQDCPIRMRRTE